MQPLVPAQHSLVQIHLQVRPESQNLQHRRPKKGSDIILFNTMNTLGRCDRVEPEQRGDGDGDGREIEKKLVDRPAGDYGQIPAELIGAKPEGSGGAGGGGEEGGGEECGEGGEGRAGGGGDAEGEEIGG